MFYEWLLLGLGLAALLYVFYRFLLLLFNILVPYVFSSPIDLKRRAGASWAVVTGATDGIGKAYAFELANRGFNVFLVSRTQSKLDATKKEIEEIHPQVEVRSAAFDFKNASPSAYSDLLTSLNEVNIGVLINNVGMFYSYPEVVHKVEGGIENLADVIVVNCLPPTLLSAGILPQMVSRKAGIVVNIGSSAAANKMAKWAVYSAAKKYVSWLTAILRKEYSNQGITFQTITPLLVSTKMAGSPPTSFFVPDTTSFVNSALNTIGRADDTTGYITHQIQLEGMKLLPEFIIDVAVEKKSAELQAAAIEKRQKLLS